jgi:glyoxylase-like metal-dependent hydrolase (beta-lactamase superfamily II)
MSMNRRSFLRTSSLALAAGAAAPRSLLGRDGAPLQVPFETIRRNVGYSIGRGGTMGWYISPDAVVVVDSQFADSAQAFLDALEGRSQRTVDALINTHHHGDHTGGNATFRAASVRMVVGHANVPEFMRRQAQAGTQPAVPDVTFTETWSQSFGGETVRAKYYAPAHTGGDAVIFFENANVAHMGDVGFNQRHPIVDRPYGASVRGWVTLLERTAADHDGETVYLFGHAKEGTSLTGNRDSLMLIRDYFSAALEHVQRGVAAGRSKEEITALPSLPRFEEWASQPPRLSLQNVLGVTFDELTGA